MQPAILIDAKPDPKTTGVSSGSYGPIASSMEFNCKNYSITGAYVGSVNYADNPYVLKEKSIIVTIQSKLGIKIPFASFTWTYTSWKYGPEDLQWCRTGTARTGIDGTAKISFTMDHTLETPGSLPPQYNGGFFAQMNGILGKAKLGTTPDHPVLLL